MFCKTKSAAGFHGAEKQNFPLLKNGCTFPCPNVQICRGGKRHAFALPGEYSEYKTECRLLSIAVYHITRVLSI